MTMTRKWLLRCGIALGVGAISFAGAISTTSQAPGTTLNVIDLTGFQTTGADMDGLSVTAVFAQGGSQTCTWADTGSDSGGCGVAGLFSIEEVGDTFSPSADTWTLMNMSTFDSLLTVILNGAPTRSSTSGVVFDRTFGGAVGTSGSALGLDAEGSTTDTSTGSASYSNFVAVTPNAPVQDIFTTLTISFGEGLGAGQNATFRADTDTIGVRGGGGDVPEPGTVALFVIGLAGLAIGRKFKASAGLGRG